MAEQWDRPTVGGHVSLDFVNTVAWRQGQQVRENLCTYGDWIRWARHVGLLTSADVRNALRWAGRHPARAEAMLARAIRLREAIYRVLEAHVKRRPAAERDLAPINEALAEAYATMQLRPRETGLALEGERRDDGTHALWSVVRSTADLLASPELELLRVCAGSGCGWLFLDRSRNHARRWCMMRDCGNREKARRYYLRHKSE
jgi:predicted RNA-binding Zn ribbon-like protein